jgi:tetratricopeptide (TPR) repeat protein
MALQEEREASIPDSLAEAQSLLAQRQIGPALDLLAQLAVQEPDNALVHQALAAAYVEAREYGAAVESARQALALDPTLARPHGVLGWVAINKGRYAEAETELRAQLEALPEEDVASRAAVHNQLGYMFYHRRRYEEAETALRAALELAPQRAVPRFNLAMMYRQARQWEEAQSELEQLLKLPDVPDHLTYSVSMNLGHLCARRGRYDDAREHFRRAAELQPPGASRFLAIPGLSPARFYRTFPFLARFGFGLGFIVLIIIVVIVWILLTR